MSAILSAPWSALLSAGIALGICGGAGVGYTANVIRRARLQTGYQMVMEDWIWHVILPLVAYAALLGAAVSLQRHVPPSLFVIGATSLLLLFIGIHNAWDTVTYLAVEEAETPEAPAGPT